MRQRTLREGSVGLIILVALGIFGGLILWIRGLNLGSQNYRVNVRFDTVAGMLPGAPVRYRGVKIGRIASVQPSANAAVVVLDIASTEFVIPREVVVEANQIGLVGETSIDIVPQEELPESALDMNPLSEDCDPDLIVCDDATLIGKVGVSYDTLIRTTAQLAERFDNPEIVAEIRELVNNTSDAAAGVTELTEEVADLADSVERDLTTLSSSATRTTDAVTEAATQFGLTAAQLNTVLEGNQATIASTLDNLSQTSYEAQRLLGALAPVIEEGELVQNLQVLSANAAQASENLRAISDVAGNEASLVRIRQTLDSAYETFDNMRKITADLDELTGDPEFRQNVRELVNGLSSLVSTTEQLQHQAEIARTLQGAIASSSSTSSASPASSSPSPTRPDPQPTASP